MVFVLMKVFHLVVVFSSVPGPLQSVQRAEMWSVILALQSSGAVHLRVDNLGVVRHVGRLLGGHHGSIPFELVKDGYLLLLIERMLHLRGLDTVRISKVKGHADEGMVLQGRVREVDRLGNDAADEAADFGRRRVGNAVIDARRDLSGVCGRWYLVILDLHRFFMLFLVPCDGGPPGIWDSEWVHFLASAVCAEDGGSWPYSPGLWVKWVSFLGSLHWPAGGSDLGVGDVSIVELLIVYELWAGERLSIEKAHPRYLRPGRPTSVLAVPFGPGIDIWRSCRFIGAMMRSL